VNVRSLVRLFVPPIIAGIPAWLRQRYGKPEWEYMPEGWRAGQSDPAIKGWNVGTVLEAHKAKWPAFLRGLEDARPFGVSPESADGDAYDLVQHNVMMSYAYALGLAGRRKDRLTMLDWGGGIGHYYLISRAMFPDLSIEYSCKDVPILAEHGRSLFPDASFSSDESCLAATYDFVLVSSSLQYSQDWEGTLRKLAAATGAYLFLTLQPTVVNVPSFVFVQRPYRYGYGTEYLGWCLNRDEVLRCAAGAGLELVREFVIGHHPVIQRAPEQNEYRGFLFRRLDAADREQGGQL
jgi:putative methyltransferase (TIGR04325 family)